MRLGSVLSHDRSALSLCLLLLHDVLVDELPERRVDVAVRGVEVPPGGPPPAVRDCVGVLVGGQRLPRLVDDVAVRRVSAAVDGLKRADSLHVGDLVVAPHVRMRRTQLLERIVHPRQWLPCAGVEGRKEVLRMQSVRSDGLA